MLSREKMILSTGTVGNPPLPDLVAAAVAGGFAELAIWPADYQGWRAAGFTDGEAQRRLQDAGLSVSQVDCLLMWTAGPASERGAAEEREVFGAATAFGARYVSVIGPGTAKYSEAELADRLAGVCERGAERGFDIALEVSPWKGNIDVPAAVRVMQATGRDNARLVIDCWHMFRGDTPLEELRAIPPGMVACVQLSDAPREPGSDLIAETMGHRLLPGAGDIDLPGFIAAMDQVCHGVAVTVEVLSDELRSAGPIEAARRTSAATRKALGA